MSSAARCLENALILQKILKSCDLLINLQLRLVSKTFNQESLRQIRASHRKTTLHFFYFQFGVNGCQIDIEKHRECFLFLTKTAGVRLEVLRIFIWDSLTVDMTNTIHKNILEVLLKDHSRLRVLTGMRGLCRIGCEDCTYKALKCREYGPVATRCILGVENIPEHHFDKLIVNEDSFWEIALCCTDNHDEFNVECSETMGEMINSRISCDHLKLVINDDPVYFLDARFQSIPRQVLERMCKVWKVKSVEIEMKSFERTRPTIRWSLDPFFTVFELTGQNGKSLVSKGLKLENVELNLLDSYFASRSIFKSPLIENIRYLLPSKNYRILNHKAIDSHMTSDDFEAILKSVFTGYHNSAITISCIHRFDSSGKRCEMPSEISIDGRVFTCSVSSAIIHCRHTVAKSFVITDKATENVLNLDVYVDKIRLEKAKSEETELGFLKYYP